MLSISSPRTASTAGGAAQGEMTSVSRTQPTARYAESRRRALERRAEILEGVPLGQCACGCGKTTPVAPKTIARIGHIKGEPTPILKGHRAARQPCEADYDEGPNGCWLWSGAITSTGYGHLAVNRRWVRAHRWYYEYYVGAIPEGLQLDHLCGVRHCVNPAHLEPVTQTENVRRGRNTRLTFEQAAQVRASTRKPAELAAQFGVSQGAIYSVLSGFSWKDA